MKSLKLDKLSVDSFVTSIDQKNSKTVKAGAAYDTSDSVVTCDTKYNCSKFCPPKEEHRDERR